mgnify:CR=1 FL=1|jgi:hypothetical protein
MYESYTYEQVKSLPDDQKIIALKELKSIYPENKMLAEHWNVAYIAVSNMVGKYLEGKQIGRKKMTNEEKAQKKLEREQQKQLELQKQQTQENNEAKKETELEDTTTNIPPITETSKPKSNAFGITLSKTLSGEEAIKRFNGIANSLLGECEYKIEISIEEV